MQKLNSRLKGYKKITSKLAYGVRVLQVTIQCIPVLKRHGNRFFVYPSSVLLMEV